MTIPPQARLPINKELTESQIQMLEAECQVLKAAIRTLEARSLAERQWITELDRRTRWVRDDRTAGEVIDFQDDTRDKPSPQCLAFTQALRDQYEAQANMLKIDLAKKKSEILALSAFLCLMAALPPLQGLIRRLGTGMAG